MKEAQKIVVDICSNLLLHFAEKHKVEPKNINIRIDLEKLGAKPVFGIFENSTLLEKCSLKSIIRQAGGKSFSMIIAVQIRSIVKDIFRQSLKQLELKDSKELFLLLFGADAEDGIKPSLALYNKGVFEWSLTIKEVMQVATENDKLKQNDY